MMTLAEIFEAICEEKWKETAGALERSLREYTNAGPEFDRVAKALERSLNLHVEHKETLIRGAFTPSGSPDYGRFLLVMNLVCTHQKDALELVKNNPIPAKAWGSV